MGEEDDYVCDGGKNKNLYKIKCVIHQFFSLGYQSFGLVDTRFGLVSVLLLLSPGLPVTGKKSTPLQGQKML